MGRLTPYQPIHPPKKQVSDEQMWAILERNSKPKVEVVQSPQAKPPELLTWTKPVAGSSDGSAHIDSACGRFRIERRKGTYYAMTNGPEFRFELGRKTTADEAKALCETEARRREARECIPAARRGDGTGGTGE